MAMQFKNNIPCLKNGIELSKIAFSGGRITASLAAHGGLMQIDYFGEQRFGDSSLFMGNAVSAWTQLFRPCLGIDDDLYYLEFQNTEFYPFGYTSHCTFDGVTVQHGLYLLNDALAYRIEVLRNPKKRAISAVLFQMNGATQVKKPTRTWTGFDSISSGHTWEGAVIDKHANPSTAVCALTQRTFSTYQVMESETHVAVTCNRAIHFEYPNAFKYNLRTARFQKDVTFSLAFGHAGRPQFQRRLSDLRKNADREIGQLVSGYKQSLSQPAITLKNKSAQSFLANTHAMMDAMKPKDVPGGARAANNGYWIWSWDSLVYGHAHPLVHDGAFAVEMLEFFKRHSHPEVGIAHSITLDMKPFLPMALNAQCLYAILLYDVYLYSGDKKVLRAYFDFAKDMVNRAGQDEVKDTGLVRGPSLYPDAVDTLGETGDDISAINNSIYYQAIRGMQALALEIGLPDVASDFRKRADRLQKNFERLFDPKVGFFYTSISASDFKPRKFYGGHAVFWVTSFAQDLVAPHVAQIGRFMEEELVMPRGFRLMPKWDQGYMRDGNNNGYYDPYVDRFYIEMMKQTHRTKEIERFENNVAWYWNQLTVPEAMSCEMENHGITVDDPGKQQLFSMKVWWSVFFHTMAGIEPDLHGLRFTACDTAAIDLKNISIRGHKLDIAVTGRGWRIDKLLLDGKPVAAPFYIPFTSLKKHSRIEVRRASGRLAKKITTHRS